MYVDIHERRRNLAPEFQLKTFYGQLEHIFAIKFTNPRNGTTLMLDEPLHDTAIIAAIRTCVLKPQDTNLSSLDFNFYLNMGSRHFVDITSVQCLVGRVVDGDSWGIIDRSGSLVRAVPEE